jgi:hypothetical protein
MPYQIARIDVHKKMLAIVVADVAVEDDYPHRLCRLISKILHQRIRCEERRPGVSQEAKKVRARKMIRELRSLGYHVEPLSTPSGSQA